jgi:hypothetical protein
MNTNETRIRKLKIISEHSCLFVAEKKGLELWMNYYINNWSMI